MTLVKEEIEIQNVIFDRLTEYHYEQLVFCHDKNTGLRAIIAIHNTHLGPGLGGTRMYHYNNDQDAITDVLRLSRGMTYKAAISGLNLGGAKAVIIGDPYKHNSEGLMRRFGRFVETLGGRYITAEDVGTTTEDMEYIKMETDHVVGLPEMYGGGGDPSPMTAYGTYLGMKASALEAYGNESLSGKKILVEGIGKVGRHLVELLAKENAKIYVADINPKSIDYAVKEFGATHVELENVPSAEMDIYSPCALGATVNSDTIPQFKCDIIAGAANNQLKNDIEHSALLKERGILYAPDYLINAGGLINVYTELNGYNRGIAQSRTEKIFDVTCEIYKTATQESITTYAASQVIAEKRIHDIGQINLPY
ncbi:MAG: Glu/Leu/Phe/Val dehydrogenase [Bacteroidia bacterium]